MSQVDLLLAYGWERDTFSVLSGGKNLVKKEEERIIKRDRKWV